jgi:phenol hydroxylase P1 protein
MQVDIHTSDIRPIRQTFSHIARRFGEDKPATRYQEATFDLQPEVNFHYRPLWQPEMELYDKRRTRIVMEDWYAFRDPRHFYYGTYTQTRAKQQDVQENNFDFVEKRALLRDAPHVDRERLVRLLVPLRHYEWGANMNNCYVTGFGYGTAITQATQYQTMDRLGLAQYLSRIGLLLDGNQGDSLQRAKQAWLQAPEWQGLREQIETLFVTGDWFEVLLVQDFVLDGLVYPLAMQRLETVLDPLTRTGYAMVVEFMQVWYAESTRWIDATLKTAAGESTDNALQLGVWLRDWVQVARTALLPWARAAFPEDAEAALDGAVESLLLRAQRAGIATAA